MKDFSVTLEKDLVYDPNCPRTKFLHTCLALAPQLGFTHLAITEAAIQMALTPVSHTMLIRGPIEVVEYFVQTSTEKLKESKDNQFHDLKTTAKIKFLCMKRLLMTKPFIQKWPQAVSLMAHPLNAANTFDQLGSMCDEMWFLAGDTSTDYNWYTKRMLLAGVYTSTELFMTQDQSEDYKATFEFLDRRLEGKYIYIIVDVGTIGRSIGTARMMSDYAVKTASSIIASKTTF
jgi:ubiquinone biosynthesis protein COQ9